MKKFNPEKIVCFHLLNDFSGSPKVLRDAIGVFKRNGLAVDLFLGRATQGFLSHLGVNYHRILYRRFNIKILTFFALFFSQFLLIFQLVKYRKRHVVFYVNTLLPFGAAIAGKLLGVKIIYHVHEVSLTPKIFKRFLTYIFKQCAQSAVFVSKYVLKKEAVSYMKNYCIYNSLPIAFIDLAKKSEYQPIIGNQFIVLMVASLKKYKGILEFIRLAEQCREMRKISFRLVLNAKSKDIAAYFKNILLPDNLHLLHTQPDMTKIYSQTSLLVNLSRVDQWIETFGLTILEAFFFGIPVIAPPVGGPVELVDHQKNGYLISSYDADLLFKTVRSLANHSDCCYDLSQAARAKADLFLPSRFDTEIMRVINDL